MSRRRGNHEGSIFKRSDGPGYKGYITLPTGKRKHFSGPTQAAVRKKLEAARLELARGLPVADDRLTVGGFLDQWLEESAKPTVRPSTYASYAAHVRLHLRPALGRVRLRSLSQRHVQSLIRDLSAKGLSPTTISRIRATLRRALNQAMKWDLVSRNVATLVDLPPQQRYRAEPLTTDQATRLLGAAQGHPFEALYNLVLATGLRQGEALALRWADVDFDATSIRVEHTLQRVNGKFELVPPKTDKSRRTLPVPAFAMRKLREHRKRQNLLRLAAGDRWKDELGLVFTTETGAPVDASNATKRFQKLLAEAGLPKKRFHDLRHTAAAFLLAQGMDLKVVQEVLGHSQISLTADTYAHVLPSLKQDAADRMDRLLGGATG